MGYVFILLALLLSRGLDLWSTWEATPDLKLETNPLLRALGWRWIILANLLACPLLALSSVGASIVAGMSVLAALHNWNSFDQSQSGR